MSERRNIGKAELRTLRAKSRPLYWTVGMFSCIANMLLMTGPLFMLLVYNNVLASGSQATLVALELLVLFLYGVMGILDFTRGRIMARVGARFQSELDARVFRAVLERAQKNGDRQGLGGLRDLEAVQRLMSSPALSIAFDLPWTPIFLAAIWMFHPSLGVLALVGGGLLVALTLMNQLFSKGAIAEHSAASNAAHNLSDQIAAEADVIRAMGMQQSVFQRWQKVRNQSLLAGIGATDVGGIFTAFSKSMRLFLQSAMLGLGAWLVINNQLSAGAMIAGSILLGRALAPVEAAISHWPIAQQGMMGWQNLGDLLGEIPEAPAKTGLPKPTGQLDVHQATVIPPGQNQAALRMMNFALKPGQACGVIGPSGAGKSTLARVLSGTWHPAGGQVRLGGASLHQYDPNDLGCHIGYLPQRINLFPGTVADNIARMLPNADTNAIHAAAQRAGAYDMIMSLSHGFDTQVSLKDGQLSGGQVQRIGLARALFGNPVLLILDEPNSNLDSDGNDALNAAIRSAKHEGCTVLIMAHRPAAIKECDLLLVIENGARKAFGPKEQVLREMVQNHAQISPSPTLSGVA